MALSLINPDAVAANEESGKLTTGVHWRHGWHRHYSHQKPLRVEKIGESFLSGV